ncbi:esterase [Lutibacter maritimus]|uniref:Enterochelin esterase n=1 Tax=Lutibacter maritimus TaxID=593133 RepID=A0A1I6RFY9_9FLAO|nr:esterase [Lutibacter maritimus]SFS63388.1 enterochelin esterase [Lutibacter maritimus]
MKKQTLLLIFAIIFMHISTYSQQALWGGQQIISPEINDDNSVTFRLFAPEVTAVQITGDFLPTEKIQTPYGEMDAPGKAELAKDEKGIWSFTTNALTPELYGYSFIVEGLTISDPNNPFLIRDVGTVTNVFIISGEQADLYKVNDIPHGTVAKRWYASSGLDMKRRLTVYTPPGYEQSTEKYPVLYLLHGAGGDEEAWMDLGRTSQIMDNLINQGKAKPMLVVMPNGNVIQDAAPGEGRDGFYKPQFMVSKQMDGTYEENFMDIVNFTENNYKVIADKEHRAIAGLSMGGYHSMHISRYYPNTFDYVGLFSAAFVPRDGVTSKVYENIDETLKSQKENGYKLYWISIGTSDFLYDANQEFKQKLDDLDMNYQYSESEGGHIWRNWRVYLSDFVPLLFK